MGNKSVMSVTVVLSCYNQERYIQECLESIVTQQVDFDFKILIADDCSTDSTLEIIKSYKARYEDQIEIIDRRENLGAAKNYLDAHQRATGDIIFHIDGDDVMLPGKIQKQYNLFRENDAINLVFHRAQYFSDDGSYQADTGYPHAAPEGVFYFDAEDLARWGSITVHSAYAYRKSSRQFVRGDMPFMEWFFAMDSLLPEGQGAYIDEILVKYRCNLTGDAYLATKKGRKRAYKIYFNDISYYFLKYPYLRKNLYSNALVTLGGMLQSRCFIGSLSSFFLKNIMYFNLNRFKNALQMRHAVAPTKKIR